MIGITVLSLRSCQRFRKLLIAISWRYWSVSCSLLAGSWWLTTSAWSSSVSVRHSITLELWDSSSTRNQRQQSSVHTVLLDVSKPSNAVVSWPNLRVYLKGPSQVHKFNLLPQNCGKLVKKLPVVAQSCYTEDCLLWWGWNILFMRQHWTMV